MPQQRIPSWLRRAPGSCVDAAEVKKILRQHQLHTVCEEARCPNIGECFGKKTATFLILGDVCTRNCRFCAVSQGKPKVGPESFEQEAAEIADAVRMLGLRHVVITSVTRDDLSDGGAQGFVATIKAIKEVCPATTVEVLTSDFAGSFSSVEAVLNAGPDVFNHNLETVRRLYPEVRPMAEYKRSLAVLAHAKKYMPTITVKTGIMLGLGEERTEVSELLDDAQAVGVDAFTAGQYMQPNREKLPVSRYLTPEEFSEISDSAKARGFKQVFVGPLVRSSYHAYEVHVQGKSAIVNTERLDHAAI